ncbi:hypothetical protein BU24DRAFT_10877 [Aaosphaeria arxii CBS 175.79]|uniref:Uncharacterized protein n=1 Tax=Aaosphaeria arxii CBS 175.79 TaxID=1450172 RepID=A0A6A5Y5T0_9PLEO|nr:uncharacterized protein BU24DRAFT_10877 [Aaosphaeria arxii CBS 175.79]KAF2020912.1 hypothetical protein BU24DRAFT_10877 [Aaosphaeria arxii CBS 175.79]
MHGKPKPSLLTCVGAVIQVEGFVCTLCESENRSASNLVWMPAPRSYIYCVCENRKCRAPSTPAISYALSCHAVVCGGVMICILCVAQHRQSYNFSQITLKYDWMWL